MMSVAEKLNSFRKMLASVSARYSRNPDEITVVAVTKLADIVSISECYNSGHRDFGENYLQKLLPKMEKLPKDIRWHYIGEIQKNKINKMIGKFALIHTVDSIEIAAAFQMRMARKHSMQDVLIEVKTSPEQTKNGIEPELVPELSYFIRTSCPNMRLCGLMTVAPYTSNRFVIAKCFQKMRELQSELMSLGYDVPHLSMGMTNDWEIAVEYGATILRIGTAIFGG